jgi:hypothetical protein
MGPKYNIGDLVIYDNNSYVVSACYLLAEQLKIPFVYRLTSVGNGNTLLVREALIQMDEATYEVTSKTRRLFDY